MQTFTTRLVRASITCIAALGLCSSSGAWAQQKQKVSYKVGAEDSKYPQRHTIQVGDEAGHTLGIYEIHRTFSKNAPVINGVKLKEIWTRGYSDLINNNGLTANYGVYVMENGDRFYTFSRTMGQADASGKRTTSSVGEIRGGTGKFSGMKGMVRATGASDGGRGFNETQQEIEYWFTGH